MIAHTLADLIQQQGRLDPNRAIALIAQVADALDAVHAQGLTHGNINLHTIVLTQSTEVGASEQISVRGFGEPPDLNRAAATIAPEQVQGEAASVQSDVYALASALYELLAGHPPFEGETPTLVLMRKLNEPAPALDTGRLGLPAALGAALAQGLDQDPTRRFPSAGALVAAAQRALKPLNSIVTVPTQPSAASARAARTPQEQTERKRIVLIVLGVIIGGLLIGLLLALVITKRPSFVASAVSTAPSTTVEAVASVEESTTTAAPHEPATSRAVLAVPLAATQLPVATQAAILAPPTLAPIGEPTLAPTLAPTAAVYAAPAPIPADRIQITASDVAPASVNSCNQQTIFDPSNVIDSNPETAWRVPGDGRGAFVELAFAAPVRVSELQIIPGYAKIDPCDGTNRFFQNRRVRQVELTFSDGSHVSGELRDDPSLQSITFAPIVTQSVRVTITDTIVSTGAGGRDFTPISEIVVMGS